MRAITRQAVQAFLNKEKFSKDNTLVQQGVISASQGVHQMTMFLHGNRIATNYHNGERGLFITNAGWFSNTTKERLNGLPNVSISQVKGVWYLNGKEWNGAMTKVE